MAYLSRAGRLLEVLSKKVDEMIYARHPNEPTIHIKTRADYHDVQSRERDPTEYMIRKHFMNPDTHPEHYPYDDPEHPLGPKWPGKDK